MKLKKLVNRGDANRACINCAFGRHTPKDGVVLCEKHGVKSPDSVCRKFKYDPLNRIPKKPLPMSDHKPEDFQL